MPRGIALNVDDDICESLQDVWLNNIACPP